ncbi:YacP-like NYN domain-containing protein [Ilumatobacter fluminis]|uniref:YacP-like NYN domain-containing protein n=1 Tax=Ilumatobacter fluminis TaxID=467091 RepID=A0A4R7I4W5_9ACTN|nr:NYN domain-containing protein [Ilumatobacter fluminis]TDT17673.1 YacP-like NYN domain-containing protein [Ilumatobacter fluminis]
MRWVVDGNNVFGSRPDGWWNDRPAAQQRLAQRTAEWCRTHDDEVLLVFDAPLADETARLAGGNLTIVESSRRGRDAADHEIVERLADLEHAGDTADVRVITSDKGLRERVPVWASVWGVGRFRDLIGY